MFYSFLRHDPVHHAGHNALAATTYLLIYAVLVFTVATGLSLYTVYARASSPFQAFGVLTPWFGGLSVARLIHHIGMWVAPVFMAVHVYFVLLASIVEHVGIFDSIFAGYKYIPETEQDEP